MQSLKNDFEAIGILFPILKSMKIPIAISALSLLVLGGLEPLFAVLMEPFLDETLIKKDPENLYVYPLLIVGLFVVKGIVEYVSKVSSQYVITAVIARLRSQLFACELRLPLLELESQTNGRLLGRVINDISQIGNVITQLWSILLKDSIMLMGLVFFLIYTSWQLSLILILGLPVIAFIVQKFGRKLRALNRILQDDFWSNSCSGFGVAYCGSRYKNFFWHQAAFKSFCHRE